VVASFPTPATRAEYQQHALGGTINNFAITTGTNAMRTTLAASATCKIYVTFTPVQRRPIPQHSS